MEMTNQLATAAGMLSCERSNRYDKFRELWRSTLIGNDVNAAVDDFQQHRGQHGLQLVDTAKHRYPTM
jgi:hypothetical protein